MINKGVVADAMMNGDDDDDAWKYFPITLSSQLLRSNKHENTLSVFKYVLASHLERP